MASPKRLNRRTRAARKIPMRPPGYFANIYSSDEIKLENELAKHSVIRPPKDLESWLLEAVDRPTTPLTKEDFDNMEKRVLARHKRKR